MSNPGKAEILAVLSELVTLTTLEEESPQSFKVRAYENAAAAVEGYPGDITALSAAELRELKGIGESIAKLIRELIETGSVGRLGELREKYPPAFVELTKIPGLGPKKLKALRRDLGVESIDQLRTAIEEERLRTLHGFGPTSESKIAKAIERLGMGGKERRTPIAEAMGLAIRLIGDFETLAGVSDVMYCGSLRRFAETVGDIDITVATTEPQVAMDHVATHAEASGVTAHGATKTSIVTRSGLAVDVRAVEPDQFGAAVLYFTGSKSHNIVLRQRAIDRDMLLNEYGLFGADTDQVVASKTEAEIYAALDLAFIPPELRENTGEIEHAETSDFGHLVELADIRGDLHCHTDRSGDGRSSLEEMVAAAIEREYEYLAITDHGEDLAMNGLSREEMTRHRERIAALGSEYPNLRLLFGCELNIGPDGSLDYDPDFRSRFEWCVASVHSHFDLPLARQTERLLSAIEDPSVKAIGHLTGRYLGRRPGIELDIDAVLDALAETGVGLEVNGALERLDAPASVVRRAVARGVRLVISTDAHHTSETERMRFGVSNSRRGWAPRAAVANTWARDEFLAWALRAR